MDARYRIRSAVPADAAGLVAIERRAFSDPWTEASFREALTSPWTFGLVAETGRGAAGYLIGRDVAGTGEVLNLAVAPEFRRRGIGGALLQAGLAALRVQHLRPGAVPGLRLPRGGPARGVLPQSEGGRAGSPAGVGAACVILLRRA